jgi:hypothetical protein
MDWREGYKSIQMSKTTATYHFPWPLPDGCPEGVGQGEEEVTEEEVTEEEVTEEEVPLGVPGGVP